ncbi:MAG TPA: DNA polymerase IV, partial [Gammaproteobacteria bacterium]|nr:DNA polymerase IV [Gammaproteobacteria bacterium]
SAMPMARARRLCPQALVVPPRFERYQEVSQIIMELFASFSPSVEPLSLDEAFLDMTGSERLFGSPEEIGRRLKQAVRDATGGLTASVGISGTKYVAKVASGYAKPDGLTIVAPADAADWLAPQPVRNLWGAGPKTVERLERLGLATIGQIATADSAWLERELGAVGRRFSELAQGRDFRGVSGSREARGLSCERTLETDIDSRAEIEAYLRSAAETVAARLRRRARRARGVRVKLKRTDFRIVTRQRLLSPTDVAAELFAAGASLLDGIDGLGPFRLVGLGAFDLIAGLADSQLALPIEDRRARLLETTIDGVRARFGTGAVQRASELVADHGVGVASNLDFLDDGAGS